MIISLEITAPLKLTIIYYMGPLIKYYRTEQNIDSCSVQLIITVTFYKVFAFYVATTVDLSCPTSQIDQTGHIPFQHGSQMVLYNRYV